MGSSLDSVVCVRASGNAEVRVGNDCHVCRLAEVSVMGFVVRSHVEIPPATPVRIQVHFDGPLGYVVTDAVVTECDPSSPGFRVAFAFLSLDTATEQRLSSHVSNRLAIAGRGRGHPERASATSPGMMAAAAAAGSSTRIVLRAR